MVGCVFDDVADRLIASLRQLVELLLEIRQLGILTCEHILKTGKTLIRPLLGRVIARRQLLAESVEPIACGIQRFGVFCCMNSWR